MIRLIFFVFLLPGCKEFYDEEFEEFEERHSQTISGTSSYTADLISTDAAIADLTGNATIEILDNNATVEISIKGVPANINQITYGLISASCSSLNLSIPTQNAEERTIQINERLSQNALLDGLRSSGNAENNLSLDGKSLIIRGVPQFSGLPNEAGTNVLNIACGELVEGSNTSNDASDVFTPERNNDSPQTTEGTSLELEF